jgi:cytochrome c oxidase subunit 1
MLLTGLGTLLFAVIYALIPMLTKLEIRSQRLVNVHFWTWIVGSVAMTYVMGMAGVQGMLRRTLYPLPNPYEPYMAVALAGGLLMAVGFLAFLVNIVGTLGWANVLSLIVPERWWMPRSGLAEA